ncbi:MAG: HEPN domain-containing protein [Bacteroidota bacterium]
MKLEAKNSKSHLSWCWKQKRGIKLEDPNNNLCNAYIEKAKSALNMLDSAIEKEEIDWIATTAYYSRYFALYALLQKCGIKSEIHDCTISLMRFLFVEEKIIGEQLYNELLLSKDLRVDTQYYVTEQIDKVKLKTDSAEAGNFVLKMEEIIENIASIQITKIRQKLMNALTHV